MNYVDALNYIHSMPKFGNRTDLQCVKDFLDHLGNPQNKLKFVHVAGTNGKGSTVAYISRMLIEAGYKVGIYTSPFIQRFTERIKVNDREIPGDEIGRLAECIKTSLKNDNIDCLTEFDLVTVMAFLYFASCDCDIVVLEVGLGGRLDSTNVIDFPEVAVITTISYDHMDVLGDTLTKIASEKAGIIKKDCEVVVYPQEAEADTVIRDVCEDRKAVYHTIDISDLKALSHDLSGQTFDFEQYKGLSISMLGDYQMMNAATAIKTIEILNSRGYNIKEEHIYRGLKNTRWAGRLEVIYKKPLLLIDGAHNIEGVNSLKECLTEYFPDQNFVFIVGVLADKDYKAMMDTIAPIAKRFITITPPSPRALSSKELAAFLTGYGKEVMQFDRIEEALSYCDSNLQQEELICAFGSLYYIGIIRDYYRLY